MVIIYTYSIRNRSCLIKFNNNDERKEWYNQSWYKHYEILNDLFNFLKDRGFSIEIDPKTKKNFPTIADDYFYGRKGNLEFSSYRYPNGFEIEFYQNINIKNKNGGKYDFDKFKKMPYIIRLSYINESNKILDFLKSKGFKNISKPEYRFAVDKIKYDYVESWHHKQNTMDFDLKDLDGVTGEPNYNIQDRDKKEILNGQIKYFRDYGGRLIRATVYHNINNMWWCILNDTEYTNIASFELFDAIEDDFMHRRVVKDLRPRFTYTVITSQYGYSYLSFVCKFNKKTFMKNAKALSKELIEHKANDGRIATDDDLGDLTYHKKKTIRSSYNINSQGDIYFRNKNTEEEATSQIKAWEVEAANSRKVFRRKGMSESIRKNHNEKKIRKMVSKYFEIV